MLGSRIAKFTAAVVITGLLALSALALTLDTFAVDDAGRRPSLTRQLRHEAAPLWPAMAEAYRRTIPPKDIRLPEGDPLPTLLRLEQIPHAVSAFHVSPDRKLTVRSKILSRPHPPDARTVVDLDTWGPELLDRVDFYLQASRRLSKAQYTQIWKEKTIRDMKDMVLEAWKPQRLPDGWVRHPWVPSDSKNPTYLKGESRAGFIGVEIAAYNLAHDEGDAILDRFGLLHKFTWNSYATYDRGSNVDFPPPEEFAFPEPLRLSASSAYEISLLPWLELRYWLLIGLISSLLVFSVSASIRQLAALLRETALAHAQSNFVSSISHEMRIPLTTVKMYADMLEQGVITDPEKRSAYLRTMSREAERLGRLIENVLDFSRISNRRKTYQFERLQVRDVVRDALAAVAHPLEQAGMTVETVVPPLLEVDGDRDALVQTLVNLLSNAIKYAPGEKVVLLSAAEGPGTVTLSVQDYGPGIPECEQAKVFRPFYRIGDELTRSAPGSGLGLTLVKEYVAAHGGTITLFSQPGEGSRFEIALPRQHAAQAAKRA